MRLSVEEMSSLLTTESIACECADEANLWIAIREKLEAAEQLLIAANATVNMLQPCSCGEQQLSEAIARYKEAGSV